MNAPRIAAEALYVHLGQRTVLAGPGFEVAPGKFTALIGPNGSGKTTLLRAIGGLLPYSGSLTLAGREVAAWPARELARTLAFVRQSAAVSFDFTAREFVALGRTPHRPWLGGSSPAEKGQVDALLDALDLTRYADAPATRLSGGEQQRLFLAQALAQDTEVLLLDEPTLHLDLYHQYDLMRRLEALVQAGKTVLAVVHDLALAARFADAVLVLQDGRLAAEGSPAEVLTPTLLADVFRMQADVALDAAQRPTILFHQTLPL
ncbi:MAG: ABC transporter ATP-binding protein [Rhodothermales bacterium]|nr:ABC transporter ATP-binding protein [Rhodothermales bacterium]